MLRTFILVAFFWGNSATIFAQDKPFITTWNTGNSTEITIPTFDGEVYSYNVYWEDVDSSTNNSTNELLLSNLRGDKTINFRTSGTYRVEITGDFPRIYFNDRDDKDKLLTVDQWGDIAWSSMEGAFQGCNNLTIPAPDVPDLSNVRSMSRMFAGAKSLNQSLSSWDVSSVRNMSEMFSGATNFDQPLKRWDVSNVTSMSRMFSFATSFNQDLSGWDVSSVRTMNSMFRGAKSFDQDIGGWNVRSVTTMNSMFHTAGNFDQDLSSWDVSSVGTMSSMFRGATSFDQDLSSWDVSNVWIGMDNMLDFSGLSIENYDSLLIGWSGQEVVRVGVTLGTAGLRYSCAANVVAARVLLTETKGWNIKGGQVYCPFITTWNTGNNTSITIPKEGLFSSYEVKWKEEKGGYSTIDPVAGLSGDHSISGLNQNTIYQVEISGAFPHIYFNNGGGKDRLLTVEQWGDIVWSSMEGAFEGCRNLTIPAWDVPDLSNVRSMSKMFKGDTSLRVDNIHLWNVSSISNMSSMFSDATSFNQALSSWNVSRVTDMGNMLDNTALSELNYENTILSWEQQPVQENVELGAEGLTYCTIGETPRQSLIDDKNWNIIGDTECLILPITLLSIEAKVIDGLVHIIWETASEIDNEYFTLERSKVGNSFEELSTIEGGGNSNQRRSYSFIDEQPYSGTSYYKLKQTDFSGATAVVGLLLIKTPDSEEELQLTVYPNPFSDTGISIALLGANEEETVTISIVDVLGRVQYTSRKQVDDQGELNLTLSDLGQWNTGLYIIQVFTEKGTIKTSTIKQK